MRMPLPVVGRIVAVSFLCAMEALAQNAGLQRANDLLAAKKFAQAAAAFESLLSVDRADAAAWFGLGSARYGTGDLPGAAAAFEKNVELSKNATAMFNLACVYARLNQKEKALSWLAEAEAPARKAFYVLDLNDPDLASLRDEPRYREIAQSVDKLLNPCMYDAAARQFDFWVGEWDAFGQQGARAGSSVIQRIANGCGILENWTNARGGGGGKSINFYDPAAGKWFQYWIGADGHPHRFSGSYRDRALRLEGEPYTLDGKLYLTRLTLFDIDPQTVRQLSEQSADGGATWSVVYDFKYVRRSSAVAKRLRVSALKINVPHMNQAIAFYRDKLGFEIADRTAYPAEVILQSHNAVQLILHKVASVRKVGDLESQLGLTLQVNDLDQAMQQMKAKGVPFGEAVPRKEAVGNAIFIATPSGMKISMMHETIVHNDPFPEPRIYNFGVLVPDMAAARDFYSGKLGFVVRSERYLPLDLPLGNADGTFAFMLHYRPGVTAAHAVRGSSPFITIVFEADDLAATVEDLKKSGVPIRSATPKRATIADPFGNVAEVVQADGARSPALAKLYDEKRYFELREAVARRAAEKSREMLFYRGAVANIFHRQRESAELLDRFIAHAGANDEHLVDAYSLRADDAAGTYAYAKAAQLYRILLDRFRQRLKPDEIAGYENVASLYAALRDVPPQRVALRPAKLNAPSTREGWLVPVVANGNSVDLGLDTGANFSLVIRSVAEKLGMKLLDQTVTFGSVTTINVQPHLGVLPAMTVGGVTVENAIFIVLEDEQMTFPDGTVIHGVIGFPVLAALGEVSFFGDGSASVAPPKQSGRAPNICLYGKDIVFRGVYRGRELPFLLDTGAEKSMLYLPFLQTFESDIKEKAPLQTQKFTGVGGTEEVPAYSIRDFALTVAGHEARLPEVRLLTKALTEKGGIFYGNIGGDLIKQFRRLTIDFTSMRMTVE